MQNQPQDTTSQVRQALEAVLRQVDACVATRVPTQDTEQLFLLLQRFFTTMETLYQDLLPTPTSSTIQMTPSTASMEHSHYHVWLHIQEIERLLDTIEPLCRLLSNTLFSVLDTLDQTCSVTTSQPAQQKPLNEEGQESTPMPEWQIASNLLAAYVHRWSDQQHISFAQQFADQEAATHGQIDRAFMLLLEDATTIFRTILPDACTIASGDDEAIALFLFNLGQQIDHAFFHTSILFEPLHSLLKAYAPGTDIY